MLEALDLARVRSCAQTACSSKSVQLFPVEHAALLLTQSSQSAFPDVLSAWRGAWSVIHRVMTTTPTFGDEQWLCVDLADASEKGQVLPKQRAQNELIFGEKAFKKWVMPASSATLITAELGRIVAVSSSNQTTSAARLNWLIAQPKLTRWTLKYTGLLSFLQGSERQKQNVVVF